MTTIRGALQDQRTRFALTAFLVAVVFILTDHRRDLIGIGSPNGEVAGPAVATTIARLALMAFAILMAVIAGRWPVYRRSPAAIAVAALMVYVGATTVWSVDPVSVSYTHLTLPTTPYV